jgi:hypothetical protein
MPGLFDLASRLQAFVAGELTRAELDAWLAPVLAVDPLDVTESDALPWEDAPDEERLFWRLVYVLETSDAEDDALRALAGRVLACLASTASAADTLELLPLVADAPRLCTVVARHRAGVVSRTGLLGLIANSRYPAHVKLWLQHAGPDALARLCERLDVGEYAAVARMVEQRP